MLKTFLLAALLAISLLACKPDEVRYASIADLAEKRICVVEGTIYSEQLNDYYPKAIKVALPDMNTQIEALQKGKCEGAVLDASKAPGIVASYPEVGILQDSISEWTTKIAFGFPVGQHTGRVRCGKWIEENLPLIDSLVQGWSRSPATMPMPPRPTQGKEGRVLRFGTTGNTAPTAFLRDSVLVGQDVDLFYRYASAIGFTVEPVFMPFRDLIPALQSGKVDAIGANITITESRAAKIAFTVPYKHEPVAVLVRR